MFRGLAFPDVLQLWLDSSVLWVRRATASLVSVLIHSWQLCHGSKVTEDNTQTGSGNGGTDSERVLMEGGGIYAFTFPFLSVTGVGRSGFHVALIRRNCGTSLGFLISSCLSVPAAVFPS